MRPAAAGSHAHRGPHPGCRARRSRRWTRRNCARLRGTKVAMIFQEPMSGARPGVHDRRADCRDDRAARGHLPPRRQAARARTAGNGADPLGARRLKNYPHEMSGGMRQRAMIALALACRPSVLLADEPTTALDVTVQIQIMLLLRQLQQELGMAVVFVTHDVGVAVEIADRIAVMYAGRFVETGPDRSVIGSPAHPYTAACWPRPCWARRRAAARGDPGRPAGHAPLPFGCSFAPRCRFADARCRPRPAARNRTGLGPYGPLSAGRRGRDRGRTAQAR